MSNNIGSYFYFNPRSPRAQRHRGVEAWLYGRSLHEGHQQEGRQGGGAWKGAEAGQGGEGGL